jgi:hypothetical protein
MQISPFVDLPTSQQHKMCGFKRGCVSDCELLPEIEVTNAKWVCPQETWRVPHSSAAIVTSLGTMSLLLRDRVRVDMTIDRAVRVINFKVNRSSALNESKCFPIADKYRDIILKVFHNVLLHVLCVLSLIHILKFKV